MTELLNNDTTSQHSAIQRAFDTMDMDQFFSGSSVNVTFKLNGTHQKYRLQLQSGAIMIKKYGFFMSSDLHMSNGQVEPSSVACQLLSGLYQCRKVSQEQFVTLLSLPGGVNHYAREALDKLSDSDVDYFICKAISARGKEQKDSMRILELLPARKLINSLFSKSDEQIRALLTLNNWSNTESYLTVLCELYRSEQDKHIRYINQYKPLDLPNIRLNYLNSLKNSQVRNWLYSYYSRKKPTFFNNAAEIKPALIGCWLKSIDHDQSQKLLLVLDVTGAVNIVQALLNASGELCEIEKDDMCIIQSVDSALTLLADLTASSSSESELNIKWKKILQKLSSYDRRQLLTQALENNYQLALADSIDHEFIYNWLQSKSAAQKTNFLCHFITEDQPALLEKLSKKYDLTILEWFPESCLENIFKMMSRDLAENLLVKIQPSFVSEMFSKQENKNHLSFFVRLTQILADNEEKLVSFLKHKCGHLNERETAALIVKFSPVVARIFSYTLTDEFWDNIITDYKLCNENNIEFWCDILPKDYIAKKASGWFCSFIASIFQAERIDPAVIKAIHEKIDDTRFESIVQHYGNRIGADALLSFPAERLMVLRDSLDHHDWKKIASRILPDYIKPSVNWVNWTIKLQVDFWVSRHNPAETYLVYKALDQSKTRQLMYYLPVEYLAALLTSICKNESYQDAALFIRQNAAHSKMPSLLVEWRNTGESECKKTIARLTRFSESESDSDSEKQQKAFLDAIASGSASEICKNLSMLSAPVPQSASAKAKPLTYASAAGIIKREYKNHRQILRDRVRSNARLVTKNNDTTYYHCNESIHPPMRSPSEAVSREVPETSGAHKKVTSSDGKYISLLSEIKVWDKKTNNYVKKPKPVTENYTPAQIELFELMRTSKIPAEKCAICPGTLGIWIADGEMIAADAGTDLSNLLKNGKLIDDISQLRSLCETIDLAHQHGFYFRDLKPSNILYKEFNYLIENGKAKKVKLSTPKLTIIDLDDLCRINVIKNGNTLSHKVVGIKDKYCGTSRYITHDLLKKRLSEGPEWLLAADRYSMCLTMLSVLDNRIYEVPKAPREFSQNSKYYLDDTEQVELRYPSSDRAVNRPKNMSFTLGHINKHSIPPEHRLIVEKVIKKYVKTTYQKQVISFLDNPVKYCLPEDLTLVEIFNWQADED